MAEHIHIPDEWKRVRPESLKGTIMVIGRSDSGKTTFARYLFQELCRHHKRVGFLDCDMGQSTLGPPTTMTLALSAPGDDEWSRLDGDQSASDKWSRSDGSLSRFRAIFCNSSETICHQSDSSRRRRDLTNSLAIFCPDEWSRLGWNYLLMIQSPRYRRDHSSPQRAGCSWSERVRHHSSEGTFPPRGEVVSYFVGSTSPRGHMLPTIIGAYKLQRKAQELGAEAIVVDTTGLVDRAAGGGELKQWKIELLKPSVLIGIERGAELEHILWPWRWDRRVRVFELPVCEYVTEKARVDRIAYRESRFRSYFERAHTLIVPIGRIVVFGIDKMTRNRLLAFQDQEGFALALGVAMAYDRSTWNLEVVTPLPSLEGVSSIRFGSLKLDPATGQEIR